MSALPNIESFHQLVATSTGAIGILCLLIGLFDCNRSVRIGAIAIVASLALFSNHWSTYFAAIFIIATAVTELEFLEKLAAIIRGSKEYFDYKKSQVPVEEVKARAAAEVSDSGTLEVIADGQAQNPKRLLPSGDAATVGYTIEQLALTYFERRLGTSIQRNVRFSTPLAQAVFDGVIERGGGRSDTLIEVKLAGPRSLEDPAIRGAKQLLRLQQTFADMTGRRSTGILVLVVPEKQSLSGKIASLKAQIQEMSHTIQFEVVDFSDIGYGDTET